MCGAEGGPSSGAHTMGPQWDREARSYSPGKDGRGKGGDGSWNMVSAEVIKVIKKWI